MKISVTSGDISRTPSDALITAINSGGAWFGGIDGVIMRAAGPMFHDQASRAMPLEDGKAVIAKGGQHDGSFRNVVFVVDDLQRPLREIVLAGLLGAESAGFATVTLPTIRMGVMLGVVEKSLDEALSEMAAGVKAFLTKQPKAVQSITFVVYNDPPTELLLRTALEA